MFQLKKAFDKVYRDGIWFKLIQYGVSSKMVKMLTSIYQSVKSCVKVNGSCSDFFDSYAGVKQGEPLSPLLFIFFVNDMHEYLYDESVDMVTVNELQIFLLLFADDTVLFSYTEEGLQCLLNRLHQYCSKWGVSVNTDKTYVMVCRKGNRRPTVNLTYGDHELKVVDKFTYLGVTLSSNGKFHSAQKNLAEQSFKALFSLNKIFDNVSLDIQDKLKLFDTMISPILNYGSETWGFHKAPDIERVHLKFLKQCLGVRPQTPSAAVYGELGRIPFSYIRQIRIVKYWFKVIGNRNSLAYVLFSQKDLRGDFINEWSKKVKALLDALGFSYLMDVDNVTKQQLSAVIQRIYDSYYQQWFAEVRNSSKLDSYEHFKGTIELEKYLRCINNVKHRSALARLRCVAHKLAIEEGRYRNIEREQRKCIYCNMNSIESEYHFLLVCPHYRDLRNKYIPSFYRTWPTKMKFYNLMKSQSTKLIRNVAAFVFLGVKKRESTESAYYY